MRRILIALLLAAMPTLAVAQQVMTPRQAYDHVTAGKAVLVDIRTPEEWKETGVPKGALRLDMTRPDFVTKLDEVRRANPDKDIALICRTSNRTSYVQKALVERGWKNVIDVRGGLAGDRTTRGWAAEGLPVER